MTRNPKLTFWLFAVVLALQAGAAAAAERFDYLYIEANEGGSSGGHVAVRFGPQTFHFQQSDGLLRLRRDDSATFSYVYAMLSNRPIHAVSVAVAGDTYEILRGQFNQRLLAQDAQLERRAGLRGDAALLALLAGSADAETVDLHSLPMAGLFFGPPDPSSEEDLQAPAGKSNESVAALRDKVASELGADFLDARISAVSEDLRRLPARIASSSDPPRSASEYPLTPPTSSQRWRQGMLYLLGLRALQQALPLRNAAYAVVDDPASELSPTEIETLHRYSRDLRRDLVQLLISPRPDPGFALLLGLGRLSAIDASLNSHRLVLLGSEPEPDTPVHQVPPSVRAGFVNEARAAFERARAETFASETFREGDYGVLELAAAQLRIARQAASRGGLPMEPGALYPSASLAAVDPVLPVISGSDAADELPKARTTSEDYSAALQRLYEYDLLRHNCVSEIFTVIDEAFSGLPEVDADVAAGMSRSQAIAAASRRRLGGHVGMANSLRFIPWISAAAVASEYRTASIGTMPSYRGREVAAMRAKEPAWKVYARELNTVTSTVYVPGADDSAFLFFTDGWVLARPFFGAVNLVVALGQSLVGVAELPFRGPESLRNGARGVISSLPELAFFNLRKGSLAFVPRSMAADD